MARLFTSKIATYYEDYYKSKGVKFIKGTVLSSFEMDSSGKVFSVVLVSVQFIYERPRIWKYESFVCLDSRENIDSDSI